MRLRTPLALAVALCAAGPAPALAAEAFYGVTPDNQLVTFQSDSPGALRTAVPLTGLAPGERILGLDVRPRTGQLYALGNTNRVYVVTPVSGAARPLGEPFNPPLAGTSFGFDFNPQADQIRVVSNGRQNLRINPDNGQVANAENALDYAAGDPGAGAIPAIIGAAYTNNVADARETQLFDIDAARDVLVLQNPPRDGRLATVGPLTVDVGDPVGFDVAADGRAFVAARREGQSAPELFTIDLKTGALAPSAERSALAAPLQGIAAAGPVPDDTARPSLLLAVDRMRERSALRRRLGAAVSCSEACSLEGTLLRRRTVVGRAQGALASAGRATLTFNATSARRRLARGGRRVTLRIRVTARDAAGNRTTTSRSIRFG